MQTAQVRALVCQFRRDRRAAVTAVELSGAGPRGRQAWHHRVRVGFHRASLAGRGRAQALAAPLPDLHHRRTEPRTGIEPFMNLVAQVMSQEPYVSAKRVFWIVDNGASHRGKKVADRLTAAFPNAVTVHASWLN
ncbi:hypothetical protein [Streptomyces bauhiniae]|uniref:hypothetical protein n=1 Tax=Streptomyces bauhiniae TaxID=2340725 RepID=UPI0035D6F97D